MVQIGTNGAHAHDMEEADLIRIVQMMMLFS